MLLQALGELETLKRQIKQPFMAKSTVEASIARMEEGLRAKTHVRGCMHGCMPGPQPPACHSLQATHVHAWDEGGCMHELTGGWILCRKHVTPHATLFPGTLPALRACWRCR